MNTKNLLLSFSFGLVLATGAQCAFADGMQWSNLITKGESAYRARNLDEAESQFKEALELCNATNFSDAKKLEESRGITFNDLAMVMDAKNTPEAEVKAEEYYEAAIKAKTRAGVANAALLPVMNNLAKLYYEQKKYKKSVDTFQQALKFAEGNNKSEQQNRAKILNSMAAVYTDTNELGKAEQSLREVITIQESLGESGAASTARNNLSVVLRKQDKNEEAQKLLETNNQGSNESSSSLTKLARVLREQQKFDQAEPLLRKAVTLVEASPEPHEKELVVALNNLAMVCREQANFEEALKIYNRVSDLQSKMNVTDTEKLTLQTNLGVVHDTMGEYEKARPYLEQSLELCEKVDGKDSINYATCLANLKELYLHLDNYEKAEFYMKQVLDIHKAQKGANDAEVGRDLNELALIYRQGGKMEQSEPTFKSAIEISEKGGDATAGDLSVDLNNLAKLYRQQGRFADAEPLYKRSLSIKERVYGADHPQVAATLRNYATLLKEVGREDEAHAMNKRAHAIEEKAGE